mmetsp:Transcript_42780/g.79231  ORF Transcript_42780/g.79231 Transcript_42780/m.79231 type:complete len:405 (-) Transcript_42780:6-1220(-)
MTMAHTIHHEESVVVRVGLRPSAGVSGVAPHRSRSAGHDEAPAERVALQELRRRVAVRVIKVAGGDVGRGARIGAAAGSALAGRAGVLILLGRRHGRRQRRRLLFALRLLVVGSRSGRRAGAQVAQEVSALDLGLAGPGLGDDLTPDGAARGVDVGLRCDERSAPVDALQGQVGRVGEGVEEVRLVGATGEVEGRSNLLGAGRTTGSEPVEYERVVGAGGRADQVDLDVVTDARDLVDADVEDLGPALLARGVEDEGAVLLMRLRLVRPPLHLLGQFLEVGKGLVHVGQERRQALLGRVGQDHGAVRDAVRRRGRREGLLPGTAVAVDAARHESAEDAPRGGQVDVSSDVQGQPEVVRVATAALVLRRRAGEERVVLGGTRRPSHGKDGVAADGHGLAGVGRRR